MRQFIAFTRPVSLVTVLVAASVAKAEVESGLAKGTESPKLAVLWLNDSDGYEEKNLSKEQSDKTAVYLFIQQSEWSRPMARFVRGVDEAAAKSGAAGVIAVWVGDDVDAAKEYLPRGRNALKLQATEFAVHPGDKTGPDGWGVNDRAFLTAVVAKDGRVIQSLGFISINETDVPKVAELLPK